MFSEIAVYPQCHELYQLAYTPLNAKTRVPQVMRCARSIRLWQLRNGISRQIEVAGTITSSNFEMIIDGFLQGDRFSVGDVEVGNHIWGAIHTHPIAAPQHLGDIQAFLKDELFLDGVLDSDDYLHILVRPPEFSDNDKINRDIVNNFVKQIGPGWLIRRGVDTFKYYTGRGLVLDPIKENDFLVKTIAGSGLRYFRGNIKEDKLHCYA